MALYWTRSDLAEAWLRQAGVASGRDAEQMVLIAGMVQDGWTDEDILTTFSRKDWFHGYSLCERYSDEVRRRAYLCPRIKAAGKRVESCAS